MKKKIIDIIAFILLSIAVQALILPMYINGLDEIWQYNFARCIAEGMVPYRDFNLVTTPMFSMVCGMFLKTFGNNLMIMRTVEVLIFTTILFLAYKILKNLKVNNILIWDFIIILFLLFIKDIGVEYNYLILILSLLLIYLELKNMEEKGVFNSGLKYNLAIGILAGLTILTKHTVGIVIAMMSIFYKLIFIEKDKLKEYIKIVTIRLIGAIIPIAILLVYLVANNALYAFYDYCILGVKTFSNKISYLTLLVSNNYLIRFFSITVPVVIIYQIIVMIKRKRDEGKIKKLIIFAYGMATFVRYISYC